MRGSHRRANEFRFSRLLAVATVCGIVTFSLTTFVVNSGTSTSRPSLSGPVHIQLDKDKRQQPELGIEISDLLAPPPNDWRPAPPRVHVPRADVPSIALRLPQSVIPQAVIKPAIRIELPPVPVVVPEPPVVIPEVEPTPEPLPESESPTIVQPEPMPTPTPTCTKKNTKKCERDDQ